jgi:hypothetical protein
MYVVLVVGPALVWDLAQGVLGSLQLIVQVGGEDVRLLDAVGTDGLDVATAELHVGRFAGLYDGLIRILQEEGD